MRNRYGDEYHFDAISDNTYTIAGELKYWRFGGKEGQAVIDYNDLGFVDPSGGPFIGIGYKIFHRIVTKISCINDKIILTVDDSIITPVISNQDQETLDALVSEGDFK